MACRPLKSVYFGSFQKPAEVLKALEIELRELALIAADTDFKDAGQIEMFERNVVFIKGYYERYERLVRDSTAQAEQKQATQ